MAEWEPWNWDLWNTPKEPDDDDSDLGIFREKLDEALKAGGDGKNTLQIRSRAPILNPVT